MLALAMPPRQICNKKVQPSRFQTQLARLWCWLLMTVLEPSQDAFADGAWIPEEVFEFFHFRSACF
ncbi:hypothetical protein WS95_22805 [Burkholderia sp. MSMB1826]|nr:hypothetical protein WS95_22805 [Burkholderia sp. MSMB1826]